MNINRQDGSPVVDTGKTERLFEGVILVLEVRGKSQLEDLLTWLISE
jgi:hypothetical protein